MSHHILPDEAMDNIFGLVEDQISINREVSKVEDRVRIIKEAETQVWIRL